MLDRFRGLFQPPALRRSALLAVLWLSGCELGRISECKDFVAVANPAAAELRTLDSKNHIVPNPSSYERLADRLEQHAKDIEALGIRDQQLRTATTSIQNTMRSVAKDCREYAGLLTDRDALGKGSSQAADAALRRKLKKTHTRTSQAVRSYKAQVTRVNELCQPR